MIKNISIKKLVISKIFRKLTFFELAILGVNYLVFSPLFCPTSLIALSGLVSVAVLVLVLVVVRPNYKWVKYAVILSLFIGFALIIYYNGILYSKAVIFDHHIYIKGQLTEEAKKFLENNPKVTEKRYFNGMGRDQSLVWTEKSLSKNTWILGGLYFSFVGFIGFGIFGGLEIIKFHHLQSVSGETAKNKKRTRKRLKEDS